jgi:hypothetical protein
MKLKGVHFADVAEIQRAVNDELKKVQKEEFSAPFQKLYDRAKTCIYANVVYFQSKAVVYVCVCVLFNMFIHNMLHYRVILHVQVYTLLHNECLLFDNNGHLSRAQNNLCAKYT